jgi:hypothetical protein
VGFHEPVDLACDSALEAAFDLTGAFPFAGAPGGVGLSGLVDSQAAERDGVEGAVELPVAGTVEPVAGDGRAGLSA